MLVDHQFVGRLREHDEAAILALVERYYDRIYRYLTGMLADPHLAAELTQETFLDAFTALPRLVDDSNLAAWLFRIATNLARKHYRRHKLVHWVALDPGAPHPADLEEQVLRHESLGRALAQLSLDQQACLLLHAWAGLTCAEIARTLGKSEEAVRMTLVRARRRFRAAYSEGQEEQP